MQRFAEQTQKKCRQFSALPLRLSVFASKFVNFQTDSELRISKRLPPPGERQCTIKPISLPIFPQRFAKSQPEVSEWFVEKFEPK
jgi:hypothetical protein